MLFFTFTFITFIVFLPWRQHSKAMLTITYDSIKRLSRQPNFKTLLLYSPMTQNSSQTQIYSDLLIFSSKDNKENVCLISCFTLVSFYSFLNGWLYIWNYLPSLYTFLYYYSLLPYLLSDTLNTLYALNTLLYSEYSLNTLLYS